MNLIRKAEQYIRELELLSDGDAVVIGVSGGADSVCLLHVLWELREMYNLRLSVVHVHHGIRGEEADRDARFVEEECGRLGLKCRTVHRDIPAEAAATGRSEEEAGREARYQELAAAAAALGGAKIAVAHNRNDNAETFLFNAFRGAGLKGLGGIPPRRGNIIRPLLCVTRAEIEEYLADRGLRYCTDATNFSPDYTRNLIRHSILQPAVEQINSRAVEHLSQTAAELARVAEYIRQQAREAFQKIRLDSAQGRGGAVQAHSGGSTPRMLRLSIGEWERLPEVLKDEVLLHALSELAGSRRNIDRLHVRSLRDLAQGPTGRQASFPYRITAQRSYGVLELVREDVCPEASDGIGTFQTGGEEAYPKDGDNIGTVQTSRKHTCPEAGTAAAFPAVPASFFHEAVPLPLEAEFGDWIFSLRLVEHEKNAKIPKNCYTKWFDYDKISSTLTLRTRQEGDYMIIHKDGMKKPLRSLFIDRKLPRRERDSILLLTAGSRVLWAVGVRAEEGLYVDGNTKRILVAELRKRG
ncbi:MAG: tRNA lysidine(34) synthetase TilS [Lachnospiraceae bacterium]|nr:tRNA lysidine(34) synthetase TilS [Lachnospiraceae bacterium]